MDIRRAMLLAVAGWCSLVASDAVASPASTTDATYLQVAGLSGPSTAARYHGWFDVSYENVVLVPGAYDGDRKVASSNCTATVRTALGAAGAAVAQMVGASIGTVKLETVSSAGLRHHMAVLRNAVLTQHLMVFENGVASDVLLFRFEAADLTTYDLKPDGSRGSGTQGSFECLISR
jgi:hypothetical protein